MGDTPQTPPAGASTQTAPVTPPAQTPDADAAATTPAAATPVAAAPAAQPSAADAIAADRARSAGIMALPEAKGRESLAQHFALSTGMSVDEAKAALAAAPQASNGGGLAMAMAGVPNPQVGADGGAASGDQDEEAAAVASIIKATRAVSGSRVGE